MRITAKPENAKLLEAVREIGDLNEVAKEFISAVNQGYLHGPCRSVAVSVGKSLLGLEKQISILLESTEGDSYQALLCDDMSGWSPTMDRTRFFGVYPRHRENASRTGV